MDTCTLLFSMKLSYFCIPHMQTNSLVHCLCYSNGSLMTGGKRVSCYQEGSNGLFNHITVSLYIHMYLQMEIHYVKIHSIRTYVYSY